MKIGASPPISIAMAFTHDLCSDNVAHVSAGSNVPAAGAGAARRRSIISEAARAPGRGAPVALGRHPPCSPQRNEMRGFSVLAGPVNVSRRTGWLARRPGCTIFDKIVEQIPT